jgi:4-hydroxybenzoate polyprenyltransferase
MLIRLRLLALLARPAVIVLLVMYAALGLAQAGRPEDLTAVAPAVAVIAGFLLFSVACNDLADEEIDRVNLPGKRPLAAGLLNRREFALIGGLAGVEALAVSGLLGWRALLVTAAGLAVSAGYSLRPVRLADRGAVASLILPACYVAVPYLLGVLAGSPAAAFRPGTLALLAGLYLGFIGRILLKDFRDVRGDVMFGKRTFLVRHGRGPTCAVSACCWLAGTGVILAATRQLTVPLTVAETVCVAVVLILLRALARTANARREEALVAATAIVGRGMLMLLLGHLSMISAQWGPLRYDAAIAALTVLAIGPAFTMARSGPRTRATVPAWLRSATSARVPSV